MLWGSWTHLCTVISMLQKQLASSNLKRQLYIHAYLCRKYLNELGKHMFWDPILSNLQHYKLHSITQLTQLQSHPSFIEFTLENKVWSSFSRINVQPLNGNCNIIIALLRQSVYMHTSSKSRFYNNYICRVCEQTIVRWGGGGGGVVLTHKREQHNNCEGGCQKKFSIEFVT